MNRNLIITGLTLSGLLALAPSLGASPRVVVRPSIGYYGYYPRPIHGGRANGEVKIDTKSKDAGVYVDGGYLGLVSKFKTFHLKAGVHDIELWNASSNTLFHEKIAVVPGKTTRINAMELPADAGTFDLLRRWQISRNGAPGAGASTVGVPCAVRSYFGARAIAPSRL